MEYTIEGIPVRQDRPRARFPIKHLQVGESFLVPNEFEKQLRRAAANFNMHYRGYRKVSCRFEADGSGIRCGRVF